MAFSEEERRGACWAMDEHERTLTLRIYRGMTLSDLAMHFRTTTAALRRLNPGIRHSKLIAGRDCKVGIDHLKVVRHRVVRGETMSQLSHDTGAPTSYSIRAWNCLDSTRLAAGDTLIMLLTDGGVRPASARPTRRLGAANIASRRR